MLSDVCAPSHVWRSAGEARMTERTRIQVAERPPSVHGARGERADHELAALEELAALTQRCLAFAQATNWLTDQSPRTTISEMIARVTRTRACLWWERPRDDQTHEYDRIVEVGWSHRSYGWLGLAPGYLVSIMAPGLSALFASMCGQTIALIEHRLLIKYQLAGLPPLAVHEKLTPRERDVLYSLALGESADDAAQRLGLSPKTIITHRHRLYQALDVHEAHHAVVRGFEEDDLDLFELPSPPQRA